jgi:hypothetical protein
MTKDPMTDYLTSTNISINTSITQLTPVDILIIIQKTPFTNSQQKEINRLLEKGVFTAITKKDILQGVYIFNSYFVDKIKHPGTNKAFKKSRLVIQAYNDQGKDLVLI